MKFLATPFLLLSFFFSANAQMHKESDSLNFKRPKLVVGIVIDQMRWDYLYRFQSLYKSNGGFKRLMNEGFSCQNTFVPYVPTFTAPGHTCIYTGSVPTIHGITGNNWFDNYANKMVYCTDDSTVNTIGTSTDAGKMSPRNMFATTVGDELRLATNFKSKVIGIAIKDRAAILPAGHTPNAAYWYDYKMGSFISSTYYMDSLPLWVQNFNKRKLVDSLYNLGWMPSLPYDLAAQKYPYKDYASDDEEPYESQPFGKEQTKLPYDLSRFMGKDYSKIASTPQGNTLTVLMAEAAITNEKLGKGNGTDMLTVSFSSPDYIGHAFGPNSWEQTDDYARLDAELGKFFAFLDATIGKGQYTVFLTADHGVAHAPGFEKVHDLPGGLFKDVDLTTSLNALLKREFGKDSLVKGIENFEVSFNNVLIKNNSLDKKSIKDSVIEFLKTQPSIAQVFDVKDITTYPLTAKQRDMFANGYFPQRSGDIAVVLKPGYVEDYNGYGTSHGVWNPYDSHIPLLWYGWGIKHGASNREVYMTDIAATVSALLHIQMPSGCIGKVIEEVINDILKGF